MSDSALCLEWSSDKLAAQSLTCASCFNKYFLNKWIRDEWMSGLNSDSNLKIQKKHIAPQYSPASLPRLEIAFNIRLTYQMAEG